MKRIAKIRLHKERALSDYDTRDLDLATGDRGWVLGELLTTTADLRTLAVLTPPPTPSATPVG